MATIQELKQLKEQLLPSYEQAQAEFDRAVAAYVNVQKDLDRAIIKLIQEYVATFKPLQARSDKYKQHTIPETALSRLILPTPQYWFNELTSVRDITGCNSYHNEEGFTYYLCDGDEDGIDEELIVAIPTKYLQDDGFATMQKDQHRIVQELDELDKERKLHNIAKQEEKERKQLEYLQAKFNGEISQWKQI